MARTSWTSTLFAILVLGLAAAGLFVLVSRRTILSFDAGSRRLRVETSVFGRVIHASTHSFDAIDHLMLKGQRDEHEIIYRRSSPHPLPASSSFATSSFTIVIIACMTRSIFH